MNPLITTLKETAVGTFRALALSCAALLAMVCVSTSTAQVTNPVYDDFSSGNLSKWSVDAAAGNTYSISDSILTLLPSGAPNYGYSTYTSTKSDFSFDRSTGSPTGVFFDMPANAFQSTGGANFEEFNFGIKDSDNNTLNARILWNGNGNSRFDLFNNTTQLAAWWQGDITHTTYFPTAGKRFALEWDGSNANLNLYNAQGVSQGTFVSAAFSGAFGNSGSIFYQFNTAPGVSASQASISMDNVGSVGVAVPEPSAGILAAASGLFGVLAYARRKRK
jgi:hypothetical protein